MANFQVQAGTTLEGFETLGDWTISGGTAALDTNYVKSGTSSLKLTSGSGTNCIATKTISLDLSRAGMIYFWVYIESLTDVLTLQVILGNDAAFANFYTKTFTTFHQGWNKLPLGRTSWTASGSPSWNTTFERLRVRVNANASVSPVVYYDSMVQAYYSRPKAVISFDDGWASVYDVAYPIMKAYGFKGSLYLIKQRIDTAGYMTTAMVQELFDEGWDVMNHTDNHVNMQTELTTQAEVEAELSACRDWIIAQGWSRDNGELHVAYPNGGYDQKVLNAMASLGMTTGRTIINRTQANEIDSKYQLCRQSHAYTAADATYQAYVTNAIAEGGKVQLNYHKIIASGGTVGTEVHTSQFQGMMDFLAQRTAVIDVITELEWYKGLTNSRKLI